MFAMKEVVESYQRLNIRRTSGICILAECGAGTHARGLCMNHYKQWNTGRALHEPLPHLSPIEQVLSRVTREGLCWIWQGSKNGPYGRIRTTSGGRYVHVVVWEHFHGVKPKGMELDHQCRNHLCVCVEHLKLVTRKQNLENMGPRKGFSSQFRGVSLKHGKWEVTVTHNYKKIYGGVFATENEANEAAIALRNRLYTNNVADRELSRQEAPDGDV